MCEKPFNPLPSHEGRLQRVKKSRCLRLFQSTSLSRGKTGVLAEGFGINVLSIHFPLTREDVIVQPREGPGNCLSIHFPLTREDGKLELTGYRAIPFNPLPSHEGRHERDFNDALKAAFNPLPSHEGRQCSGIKLDRSLILSIHFPLTREDFHPQE